jgi:hypothetical protein
MTYSNAQPFDYINIYEYYNRTYKNDYSKISKRSITTYQENNILYSSFTYNVTKNNTQYIALEVTPKQYIKDFSIMYEIVKNNNSFELFPQQKKILNNLISGAKYYIYISMKNRRKIEVIIQTDSSRPFDFLYIYELNDDYNIDSSQNKIYKEVKANVGKVTFTYTTSDYSVKQVVLEISPIVPFESMYFEFDYSFYISTIVIIIIIIICFCIISYILIIIYVKCKERKAKSVNDLNKKKNPKSLKKDSFLQSIQLIDKFPEYSEEEWNENKANKW